MKMKFEVLYDSDRGKFTVDSSDVDIEHSGSSYLRIKVNGKQIGQIDGMALVEDNLYNHLSIRIGKECLNPT